VIFVVGVVVGVTLGMLVIAFLATNEYDRGYEEADMRRRYWRAELAARREAVAGTRKGHLPRRHPTVAGETLAVAARPA